jgi:excisionase family DNA binding protein
VPKTIPSSSVQTRRSSDQAIPQSQFVSVAEAADLLRISKVSIRRYLGMGKLKKFKVGSRTLIRREDVLALVREA